MKVLIFFLLISVSFISLISTNKFVNNKLFRCSNVIILIISLGILFGWRTAEDFADTTTYAMLFEKFSNQSLIYTLNNSPLEKGYTAFQWIVSQLAVSTSVYFFIIFILFFSFLYFSFRKIYSNSYLFALLGFICTPMFATMSGNIIRTGLAFSFLLLGTIYIYEKKRFQGLLWLLTSITFHTTVLPFAILLLLFNVNKYKFKLFILGWIVSAVIFLTNIQTSLFPFLIQINKIEVYTSQATFEQYGSNGIRLDFFLFNAFLVLSLLFANKIIFEHKNSLINFYLKVTFISSIIFHLLGFIAFSDRLAIYVWLFFVITLLVMVIEVNKKYSFVLPIYLAFSILFSIITKSYLYFH